MRNSRRAWWSRYHWASGGRPQGVWCPAGCPRTSAGTWSRSSAPGLPPWPVSGTLAVHWTAARRAPTGATEGRVRPAGGVVRKRCNWWYGQEEEDAHLLGNVEQSSALAVLDGAQLWIIRRSTWAWGGSGTPPWCRRARRAVRRLSRSTPRTQTRAGSVRWVQHLHDQKIWEGPSCRRLVGVGGIRASISRGTTERRTRRERMEGSKLNSWQIEVKGGNFIYTSWFVVEEFLRFCFT